MHAKTDLRVLLKWMIAGSGSVIAGVIPLPARHSFMNFTLRNMLGATALIAMACCLLTTPVYGPAHEAVAFYLPIIICSYLVWHFRVRHNSLSVLHAFGAGAVGGVFGTLLFPTGIIAGILIFGDSAGMEMGWTTVLVCLGAAILIGGILSATLTAGFSTAPNAYSSPAATSSE